VIAVGVLVTAFVCVLLGVIVPCLDSVSLIRSRLRQRRLAGLERGASVRVPVDLRDPELTCGAWENGHVVVGAGVPLWQARRAVGVAFHCPELHMASADGETVAFRSETGRTELRVHAEEAPAVLRALGAG
jgi:hypothetical protein